MDACRGGGVPAFFRYMIREKTMRNHVVTGLLCLAASWVPATSASAAAMEWNTLFEAASGPLYPSSGHVEFGLREGLLLPAVQRSLIQVGLENVICDGSVMPAAILGGDNGGGAGIGPRASLNLSVGDAVGETLTVDVLIEAFGNGSVRQGAVMQDFHFNDSFCGFGCNGSIDWNSGCFDSSRGNGVIDCSRCGCLFSSRGGR